MNLEHPPERPALRATDQDRDAAAAMIQEAHGDGRLDVEEMDQRLTRIYTSKTQLELREVTADLVPIAHGSGASTLPIVAKHSSQERTGPWRVPPHIVATAEAAMIKLDFTEAIVQVPSVLVEAHADAAGIVLVVPRGWSVDLDELNAEHGVVRNKITAPPRSGATRLRVTGLAKHGSIVIRHPRPRRWWWPWRSR